MCGCAERREKIKAAAAEISQTAMRLFEALGGEREEEVTGDTAGDGGGEG